MLRRLSLGDKSDKKSPSPSAKSPKREVGLLPRKFQEMFRFMEKGKWDKAHKILKANSNAIRHVVDSSGLTPLALAVSFHAPEYIVRDILRADPESPQKVDAFGATPLHLACLNGTTPDIVRLIMEQDNGLSAKAVDRGNYSVLHHAVEYICLLIENRHKSFADNDTIESEHEDYLEIIKLICSKAPHVVHYKTNDDGDTPLDIPNIIMLKQVKKNPQLEGRLLEVYQLLKRVSVSVYRHRKRQWESASVHSSDSKAIGCDGSLPSMMSSNASSSAVSRSISLFKDSVADSCTNTFAEP